jgi:hypothetical protein
MGEEATGGGGGQDRVGYRLRRGARVSSPRFGANLKTTRSTSTEHEPFIYTGKGSNPQVYMGRGRFLMGRYMGSIGPLKYSP